MRNYKNALRYASFFAEFYLHLRKKPQLRLLKNVRNEIRETEKNLMDYLLQGLVSINGIKIYDEDCVRVSTCCFTLDDLPSDKAISLLDSNGICARGGIHCAILAHEAIGTVKTGAVRISLNYKNTKAEIDQLLNVLRSR